MSVWVCDQRVYVSECVFYHMTIIPLPTMLPKKVQALPSPQHTGKGKKGAYTGTSEGELESRVATLFGLWLTYRSVNAPTIP